MIRAIFSIREQCALMNAHCPGKFRQGDIMTNTGRVNQGFEQDVIGFWMREIGWFVSNVGRGEFDLGW